MLTTTCTVIPGAAKKPIEYKANGTIDSYAEVGAAEVVHGTWFACVKGGEVEFRYFYHARPECGSIHKERIIVHKVRQVRFLGSILDRKIY